MSVWSWIGLADRREILALQSEISTLIEENKAFQEQNRRLFENLERTSKNNFDIIIREIQNNGKLTNNYIRTAKGCIEDAVSSAIASSEEHISLHKHTDAQILECIRINNENAHTMEARSEEICCKLKTECLDISEKNVAIRKEIVEELHKNSELRAKGDDAILCKIAEYAERIGQALSGLQEQMDKVQERILSSNLIIKESEKQIDKLVSISKKIEHSTNNLEEVQEQLLSLAESVKYLWTITKAIWVDSVLADIDSLK